MSSLLIQAMSARLPAFGGRFETDHRIAETVGRHLVANVSNYCGACSDAAALDALSLPALKDAE